jgi:hypothetical protein
MTDRENWAVQNPTDPSHKKALRTARAAVLISGAALIITAGIAANSFLGPIHISFGDSGLPTQDDNATLIVPAPAQPSPTATPVPADVAAGIRVITHEGSAYAMDANSGVFFRFEGAGMVPTEVDPQSLPPEVVMQLRAGDGAPAVADTTEQYERAMAQNEQIAQGLNPEQKINELLANKEMAGKFLQALEIAPGIDLDGVEGMEKGVYVFFDPTCPWCHRLYMDMDGELDSKWLPTVMLGPEGIPLLRHIIGDDTIEVSRNDQGSVGAIELKADERRSDRLRQVVGEEWRGGESELTPEIEAVINNNEALLRLIFGRNGNPQVPTIVVALPDGTARMLLGYEENTVEQIRKLQEQGS